MKRIAIVWMAAAGAAWCADQATLERGAKESQRQCLPCHSLRIVHSQRLNRAQWNRELDKMAGWGVKYTDRESLLEYLVANYGDDRPMAPLTMTADGTQKK